MKRQSQNKKVLKWLQRGRSLTQVQAVEWWGIYRLGARIYELRKLGYNIKSELQFEGSSHWSKYTLEP